MKEPAIVLLDTNVWVDYFDTARCGFSDAFALVDFCLQKDICLCYCTTSIKDVFYILNAVQKRTASAEEGDISSERTRALGELAWGCIRRIYEMAAPICITPEVLCEAFNLKSIHADFEDDVILAAAKLAKVDFLVTNDHALLKKAVVPTLSTQDMLSYLQVLDS